MLKGQRGATKESILIICTCGHTGFVVDDLYVEELTKKKLFTNIYKSVRMLNEYTIYCFWAHNFSLV